MTSRGRDNQPHLTASKLCEANRTGVRLAVNTGTGQPVTHKTLTSPPHPPSISPPSLLRIYSSLKYVGTVYVCTKSLR